MSTTPVWLFDLDDTLHHASAHIFPHINRSMTDYIMQHLGHLWEQYGAREEIEDALWVALDSGDETTPGTALIALSRGYARDGKPKSVAEVRERALQLAGNGSVPLATRVTALAIAGEGGGREVKDLAGRLLEDDKTPVILRKVAENAAGR